MNVLWPRFINSAYRKEPISSFIILVGAVDIVIGGVGGHWSLLSFGTIAVVAAVIIRWRQVQKAQAIAVEETPKRFLPPSSSHTPLPVLTNEKRRL